MKIWKLSGSLNSIQTLPQAATDFKRIATFCCWVERCVLKAGNVKVLPRRKFTSGVVDFFCISYLISRKRNQMWNWFEIQVFNFFCWNVVSIPVFLGYFFFPSVCVWLYRIYFCLIKWVRLNMKYFCWCFVVVVCNNFYKCLSLFNTSCAREQAVLSNHVRLLFVCLSFMGL